MYRKSILALCGATVALGLGAASAAAAGPAVSVRVEGLKKELLAPTLVRPGAGWVTRFGAPQGSCANQSAAGALDLATHDRWRGTWSKKYGEYEISTVLGEAHIFSSKYFWELFVNNVAASSGACGVKLHSGQQLLFAAVPQTGFEYPLRLSTAHSVVGGKSFRVKVVWFNAGGKAKALAGAQVTGRGIHAVTNRKGIATITAHHRGTLVLHAARKGYIRAAPAAVLVS